jgi:hypothetical protein
MSLAEWSNWMDVGEVAPKFMENGELDTRTVFNRITTALDWSCVAAGNMQTSGLCCDCFTVIVQRTHEPEFDEELTPVSLCRINFLSVLEILAELKGISSSDHIAQSKLTNVLRLLHETLHPIFQDFQGTFQSNDLETSLHSLSLAIQFISLRLLS